MMCCFEEQLSLHIVHSQYEQTVAYEETKTYSISQQMNIRSTEVLSLTLPRLYDTNFSTWKAGYITTSV